MRFPGSFLAVSVLRKDFTDTEKTLLRMLVRWTRKLATDGGPRNRVLLLTGLELMRQSKPIGHTWKEIGGQHANFSDYHHTRSLLDIAESSIAIHLDMPNFENERHAAWNKKPRKNPNAFPRLPGQWGRVLYSISGPGVPEASEAEH